MRGTSSVRQHAQHAQRAHLLRLLEVAVGACVLQLPGRDELEHGVHERGVPERAGQRQRVGDRPQPLLVELVHRVRQATAPRHPRRRHRL